MKKEYKRILDVGCGQGELKKTIKEELYGIDHNKKALEEAKKRGYKETKIVDLEKGKIPYPENYFDAVYCIEVLQYIKPKKRKELIKEMRRVAKKEIIVAVPNYNCTGIRSILSKKLNESFFESINTNYYPTNKDILLKLGKAKIIYITARWETLRNWWGNILASEVVAIYPPKKQC